MPKKPLDCHEACTDLTYHELRFLVVGLAGGLDRLTDRATADRFEKDLVELLLKDQTEYPSVRRDLTDRECAGVLGGLVGAMVQMAPIDQIRNALAWWSETDEPWVQLGALRQMGAAALGRSVIAAAKADKPSVD